MAWPRLEPTINQSTANSRNHWTTKLNWKFVCQLDQIYLIWEIKINIGQKEAELQVGNCG